MNVVTIDIPKIILQYKSYLLSSLLPNIHVDISPQNDITIRLYYFQTETDEQTVSLC